LNELSRQIKVDRSFTAQLHNKKLKATLERQTFKKKDDKKMSEYAEKRYQEMMEKFNDNRCKD
jgi:hypothetical protein